MMAPEPQSLGTLAVALLPFAISTSITPGPNNLMLTVSVLNFGFRRTVPLLVGITTGFPIMLLAVGLGMGRVFDLYPSLHRRLVWAGAGYLLFLAWKIATSAPPAGELTDARTSKPITFFQAALFQWVNPKAWIMAFGAMTTYTTPDAPLVPQVCLIVTVFATVGVPSMLLWALLGRGLTKMLRSTAAVRTFNCAMAALLVASLAFLFY